MLQTGSLAADFTLPAHDGGEVTLSDLRGGPVVVYFYPKAGTPGCTRQACGIRDHRAGYKRAGATVLGISRDPVAVLKQFVAEHGLTRRASGAFRLLSDPDHAVADEYGVWVEKSMYGRPYMGIQRATFLIDPEGRVAHVIPKANPKTHDEVVLAALGA
jgi:peroxiredoxin Q/BCP